MGTTGGKTPVVFRVLLAAAAAVFATVALTAALIAGSGASARAAVLPWPEGWSAVRLIDESSPYVDGFGAALRGDVAVALAWAGGDERDVQTVRFAWIKQPNGGKAVSAMAAGDAPAWIPLVAAAERGGRGGSGGSGGVAANAAGGRDGMGRLERPVVLVGDDVPDRHEGKTAIAQVLWLARDERGGGVSRLWRAMVGEAAGKPRLLELRLLRESPAAMTGLAAALGPDRRLHAVWSEVREGNAELVHGAWNEAGREVAPPRRITFSRDAESGRASLVWGSDGLGRLAWLEDTPTGTEAWFAMLGADGGVRGDPGRLGRANEEEKRGPALVSLGGGRTAVAWSRATGGFSASAGLSFQLIGAGGRRGSSEPIAVRDVPGHAFEPWVAAMPDGAGIATRGGAEAVAVVFSSDDIMGVRTFYGMLDLGGHWLEKPVPLDVSPSGSTFPWIGVDPGGKTHVLRAEFRPRARYALALSDTVSPRPSSLLRKAGIDEEHPLENILILAVLDFFIALFHVFANLGLIITAALVLWLWRRLRGAQGAAAALPWGAEAAALFGLLFALQFTQNPLFVAKGAGADTGLAVVAGMGATVSALILLRVAGMRQERWMQWWTPGLTGIAWMFFDFLVLSLPVSMRWL